MCKSLVWGKNNFTVHIVYLILFAIEYLIGFFVNTDVAVLFTLALYGVTLYRLNIKFVVKYFYFLVGAILHLLGVFVCDTRVLQLNELNRTSSHNNCFGLAVIAHVLMIMFMLQIDKQDVEDGKEQIKNKDNGSKLATILIWIFILIQAVAVIQFLKIGSNVALGLDRKTYADTVMSDFSKIVKGNQVLFIPIMFLSKSRIKKIQMFLFMGEYLFIDLWSGEKFGAFFLAFYFIILFFFTKINMDKVKKIIAYIAGGFLLLFVLLYSQYTNFYKVGWGEFTEYLFERLAQQGQVWWAVYEDYFGETHASEVFDEIGIFTEHADNEAPYAGQWKMMEKASGGYHVIRQRISIKSPLTSSTSASIYYYFGAIGILMCYPFLGWIYSKSICWLLNAYRKREIILMILTAKLFLYVNSMVWASDFRTMSSWKIMILFLGIIAYRLEFQNRRVVFSKRK